MFVRISLRAQQNIYVNADNTAGPWDGTSAHPYQTIEDGLAAALKHETVVVEQGNYHITENLTVPDSVTLLIESNGICQFGDGMGMTVYGTLLVSGTASDSVIFTHRNAGENWSGIRFMDSNAGSELRFCRIEHAAGTGDDKGGAIYCSNSSPEFTCCLLQHNSADYGGAFYCEDGSSPGIRNCVIKNNTAALSGGVLFSVNSMPKVLQNYILDNQCHGSAGGGGVVLASEMGLFQPGMDIELRRFNPKKGSGLDQTDRAILPERTMRDRRNLPQLGGLLSMEKYKHEVQRDAEETASIHKPFFGKVPVIEENTFSNNISASKGGAIIVNQNNTILYDNTFEFNMAASGGSVYHMLADSVKVEWNLFEENQASTDGGAVYAEGGNCNGFARNLMIYNRAGNGGGIFLNSSNFELINNTLFSNDAGNEGSGVYSGNAGNILKNNIFWDNNTSNASQLAGTGLDVSFCDIEGGYSGTANLDVDPMFADTTRIGFQLGLHSPCINSGHPNSPKDPDSSRADMGVYYYHRIYSTIDVIPVSFNVNLRQEMHSDILTIQNTGENELHWNIVTQEDWIHVSPGLGITPPEGIKDIELEIRKCDLESDQTYQTEIIIYSNDRYYSEMRVPVSVRVEDHFAAMADDPIVAHQTVSRGHCWGDYDNDGDLDVFVANGYPDETNNDLYQNNGDGSFSKVTEGIVVGDGGVSLGCSWGDFDNDGDLDLFVTNSGQDNFLYENSGDGTFIKITEGAIVTDGGRSTSCSWGDYDNDGLLDLVVSNGGDEPGENYLYHNDGDGNFSKVISGEVVNDVENSHACGWCDYDNDGDLDLFVCNYQGENNSLYLNNGNGSFTKMTDGDIVNNGGYSLSGSWGDMDNDGDMDLFVSNWDENDFLYINNGNGTFTKISENIIVDERTYSYVGSWGDYDNDGYTDLIVSDSYRGHRLYCNMGDMSFSRVNTPILSSENSEGTNSNTWADYDNDGDLDLFCSTSSTDRSNHLYVNTGNDNHWINIKCVGGSDGGNGLSNASAIGAKIRVKAQIQSKPAWQMNEVSAQTGCREQNSLNVEFGLGDAEVIDSLKIEWPSGNEQVFQNVAVDQFITIYENTQQIGTDRFVRVATGDMGNDIGYSLGSGWCDYDNDGDLDLYVCNSNGEKSFFYNNNADGSFSRTDAFEHEYDDLYKNSCTWGDYDNDGDLDLFVTVYYSQYYWVPSNNYLYGNNGDGTFTRIYDEYDPFLSESAKSYGCSWADYNNDGYLDMFFANRDEQNNSLYVNNKNGSFTKITSGPVVTDGGESNYGAWADYDNDGDVDLFVANTNDQNNFLYNNNGDGTFSKVESGPAVTDGGNSAGGSWGDYDNDGDLDLFVTNSGGENNFLYNNDGNGTFTKITEGDIVNDGGYSLSANWIDYDNDGDLDLYVLNWQERSFLYENTGSGSFHRISEGVLSSNLGSVQGSSWGDFDNDGDLDVYISLWNKRNLLFRNNGNTNNWVNIKCIGAGLDNNGSSNTSAIGTKIWVKAVIGGSAIWQMNEITGQTGFYAQSSLNSEFGLGNAANIDSIKVEWPSGVVQEFEDIAVNRFIVIQEGEGIVSDFDQFVRVEEGSIVTEGGQSRGCNWIDYDNDGDLDLFAVNGWPEEQKNFLYRNDGRSQFTKIAAGEIVNDLAHSICSSWGDYDNDGDLDVFVTNYDGQNNNLYSNNGDDTFTKISHGEIVSDGGNSQTCSWGDYDNDGDLDLFIANYSENNSLYQNNGDGSFTKISSGSIVTDGGISCTGIWGDYDNDGDLDMYVTNWDENNFLYENNGDGSFTKKLEGDLINENGKSVGASWGDYDNDGDLDLFVVNYGENNSLHENNGDGSFAKINTGPVVEDGGNSIGSSWVDYDNDGDLDLFVTNYSENNFLYENTGAGTFEKITQNQIIFDAGSSYGQCWGDYDNDGDMDVFVGRRENEDNLLCSNLGNSNHWVKVKCIGSGSISSEYSNVSAIGTKVRVKANINGSPVWQMNEISGLTGYLGQNSLPAEFGLGNASCIDSLKIEWPSGLVEVYENLPVDQLFTITEGGTTVPVEQIPPTILPVAFSLSQNYPNPFNSVTTIEYALPKNSYVEIIIYDLLGRKIRVLRAQEESAGYYFVVWDGLNHSGLKVTSGIYICSMVAGNFRANKKILLLE
jgi:hypothetical protein